jgi:hypothetical protein
MTAPDWLLAIVAAMALFALCAAVMTSGGD